MRMIARFFLLILLVPGLIALNYFAVSFFAGRQIIDNEDEIPAGVTLVIPGAGDSLFNYYFKGRVETAVWLFETGKINRVIVLGKTDLPVYDETNRMEYALVEKGIPPGIILKDDSATRTFTQVLRVQHLALNEKIIFVSQQYHLERILFVARMTGLHAKGFVAKKNLPYQYKKYHRKREVLARVKCTWECLVYWVIGDGN